MNTKHIYESLWYGICLNLPGFLYLYLKAQNKSSMVKIHQEQLMPKERNSKYQEASHKCSLNIYYTNSGILGKSY